MFVKAEIAGRGPQEVRRTVKPHPLPWSTRARRWRCLRCWTVCARVA